MVKKKSTKTWINKHSKDKYVKLSQSEGYRSRAFHKLFEIDNKFKIINSCHNILDLGSAPGSWSEYISKNYDKKNIVAIDILEMKPMNNVNFIRGDINEPCSREQINKLITRADLVLSDIAPNITGIEDIDQANFVEIFESILEICSILLKKKGILVMKFFNGSSYDMVRNKLIRLFNKVNSFKPESSRSKSNEIFFICNGFKD